MDINNPPSEKFKKLALDNFNESFWKKNIKIKIKITAINNLSHTIKIGWRSINTPKIEVKPHKNIKKCKWIRLL